MFSGDLEFLSNFSRYSCELDDVEYPTVENAFQAAKLPYPSDRVEHFKLNQVSPAEAKRIGRSVQLRPDWEQIKLPTMRLLLASKFTFHSGLASMLVATGNLHLVETNTWHDQIWGDCICGASKCASPGQNLLGSSLMWLRFYLAGGNA